MRTLESARFSITSNPIETEKLKRSLFDPRAGAIATFEGHVRNHNEGRSVASLEYESCQSLAEAEAKRIFAEAIERFDIIDATCVHRVGELEVGDIAVFVAVSSKHREAAFQAVRYIIDEVKGRLPIWKKETYVDGTSGWINCQSCGGHEGKERPHE